MPDRADDGGVGLLALAVALTLAAPARHAVLPHDGLPVDVWKDASGEYAFRYGGDLRVVVDSGRSVYTVDAGVLTRRDRYLTKAAAFRVMTGQIGVTPAELAYALTHGDVVARPSFMTPPKAGSASVTYTDDFARNLAAFRRAVRWPVPASSRPVLGFRLTDAVVVNFEGTTRASELFHDLQGRVLSFQTADPKSDANGTFFRRSHDRLNATARFTDGNLIVRRGAGYVLVVVLGWTPTLSQWRTLSARARA